MAYAPQANDNRGGLMLAGLLESGRQIGQGAAAATQWLNQFLEQQKQINAAGKSADYFVKANPDSLNQMGIHEDEWANLGAKDKAMAVQGFMQAQGAQAAASEARARTQLQAAQAARLQQTTQLTEEESQALPALMQNLDALNQGTSATSVPAPVGMRLGPSAGTAPPGFGGGLSPDQAPAMPPGALDGINVPAVPGAARMSPALASLVHAAAGMGATNPRLAASIARQVLPKLLEAGGDAGGVSFEEDPVNGFRFVTKGKQLLPSGINPAKGQPQMVPQHDEDGNLIGFSELDARGHSKFTPAKGPKLHQAIDASTNEAIPGYYVDEQGKVHDTRSAIQKIAGTAPSSNAPAPAAGGGAQRVSVQKNGKTFTVPRSQLSEALKQGYTEVK